jgi:beta-xylosidase
MLIRTNVEKIGDPFIVYDGNNYYMYATGFDVAGFKVRVSSDLKSWQEVGVCLDLSDSWAEKDFWAPKVIYYKGKYVMHYSARRKTDKSMRIGVAVSDTPEGPFQDVYNGPMFDFGYAAIDGHVFIDDDGERYFYYSKDCSENVVDGIHTSHIYVVKLNEDLTKVVSEPIFLFGATEAFECKYYKPDWRWNEGPFMLKKDGRYYLTYSGNCYGTKEYCVCLAVSQRPDAEFKKQGTILTYEAVKEDFSGPGHNAFFKDKDGRLKMAFHIHADANNPSGNRKACVCDAEIKNDTITFDLREK